MDGDTKDVEFTKDKTNQHQARVDNAPNFLELPELPDRPMRRIDVMLNEEQAMRMHRTRPKPLQNTSKIY